MSSIRGIPPAVDAHDMGLWHSLVVLDALTRKPVHIGAPRALSLRP
jgi:hypothetical protein